MAGFGDLARGSGRASPVDRYAQGLRLGLAMEADDEASQLRQMQANKIADDLRRRRREADPALAQHLLTVGNPSVGVDSPEFKESASAIQGLGFDAYKRAIDARNTNSLIEDRQKTDIDDELLTLDMAESLGEATGQDLTPLVGKATRGEAFKVQKEVGAEGRSQRTAGIAEQRADTAANMAGVAAFRAETDRQLATSTMERREQLNKLTGLQSQELERVLGQGGFKTEDHFADWAVPFFLTIMTNGRVARRGKDVPEAVIAEAAANAAWRRVTDGVDVGNAVADVMRRFDIKPTEKKAFGRDIRAQPDSLLEETRTKKGKTPTDEELADAIRKALGGPRNEEE